MTPKIIKRSLIILLPAIALLCMGIWYLQSTPMVRLQSNSGTIDLSGADFQNTLYRVPQTVDYVAGALLTPNEFEQREDIRTGYVPDDVAVVTMRLRILVPDNRAYGISGFSANHASSVYVNGSWLFDEGKPGLDSESEDGNEALHLFSAQPRDGVIEILVATSSFSHQDTSIGMYWHIGDYQTVRSYYVHYTFVSMAVMAWYIIIALVSLILLLAMPSYRANGWMALLSIVLALRTGLTGDKPLLTLAPFLDWSSGYRIEMLTIPLSFVLIMFVFHSVFPGALPKWFRRASVVIACISCGFCLFLDTMTLSRYGLFSSLATYALMAVMGVLILVSLRKNKPSLPQVIILIGAGLVLVSALWDIGYYSGNWFNVSYAILQPMLVVFSLFMLVSTMLATMQKAADAESEAAKLRIEVLEREADMVNARTATMLSQIQPHFLYNALTSINNLSQGNPQAREAITTFSKYLRGNLDSLSLGEPVQFAVEMEHVRQYLWLEKLRFEDQLQVVYEIGAEDFSLPVLSVQPIVENAVRYGITKKDGVGILTICSEETENAYRITVKDDGLGFDPQSPKQGGRSHTGIDNVRARLHAMCGGILEIHSVPGVGTTAIIEIPKERSQPA